MDPIRSWPDTVPPDNRTLGWSVLEWVTDYVFQPDGPDAGDPFTFTPEQVRIVLRWFEIDDRGAFKRRSGTVRRLKGWGKDPFLAVLALVEFVGPCRFGGWDADGEPIAVPHKSPWVQIAAVSLTQTRNTMRLMPGLMSPRMIEEFGIDPGKEIIYSRAGGVLEAVTSSPRALEGGRATFVVMNETQHWLANNSGHDMAMTIAGNIGKSRGGGARSMQITNAPLPGEDSVAEQTWDAWAKVQAGELVDAGMYYDSIEAPATVDLGDEASLREGILAARGDATWLDIDWIISTIYQGTYPPWQSRRMFLNQLTAPDDALVAVHEWDACATTDRLEPGDDIVLGFDGGRRDDATALVAIRINDRLVQPLGIWEAPDGPAGQDWEVDREAVDGMVRNAFEVYKVRAFFADVALWESYVDQWSQDFRRKLKIKASARSAVGRDMRGGLKELTEANERLVAAIVDGKLKQSGHPALRRHVLNTRRRLNAYGVSFGKEHRESKRKVDGYAATMLADLARRVLLESPKYRKRRMDGKSARAVVLG
ncbi:terminase [Nocardiopsis sp. NPDC058789]|uniref:terminase n=1 Tax=Nocardiopsis sp. NPDC058789 TaxID=3346634 RepID=UPI00366E243A